jgi:hypothetical protein
MTLEELKAEADKFGYRLVEKQPYIPFPSCKCTNYRKGLHRFEDNDGYYYECDICGCSSESARTVREAQLNWYNLTKTRFGREEVKRR